MCVSSPAMKSSMMTPSSAMASITSPRDEVEELRPEDGAGQQLADDDGSLRRWKRWPSRRAPVNARNSMSNALACPDTAPPEVDGGILLPQAAEEDT